jgi:hypothetical protein
VSQKPTRVVALDAICWNQAKNTMKVAAIFEEWNQKRVRGLKLAGVTLPTTSSTTSSSTSSSRSTSTSTMSNVSVSRPRTHARRRRQRPLHANLYEALTTPAAITVSDDNGDDDDIELLGIL